MKNKNISVVYIVTKLELGGAQKVCLSLFNGLQKNGCHSFLISGKEGYFAPSLKENSYVYFLPTMKREVSFKTVISEVKNFFALASTLKKLRKQNPEVIVHTHSTKAGLVGRWAAWWAGIKTKVHTVHGYGFHPHQSKIAWFVTYLLELVTYMITTHYVCVSACDAKTGQKLFPGFVKHHSIIRAAVDHKAFYRPVNKSITSFKQNNFIFGSISCFKPQKNLIHLLQAFEAVYIKDQRARLEIIGDGVQRRMLEDWIEERQLSSVITLHGWQQDVANITNSWHVFVMSSLWEGLPCAIVEARLQHLPIISYKTGGIPEVVINKKNGFLYEQGNWLGLARGMQITMQKPHVYNAMQQYPDNLDDFNTSHMIAEHIRLYKELLT